MSQTLLRKAFRKDDLNVRVIKASKGRIQCLAYTLQILSTATRQDDIRTCFQFCEEFSTSHDPYLASCGLGFFNALLEKFRLAVHDLHRCFGSIVGVLHPGSSRA